MHYILTYHDFVGAYAQVHSVYWEPVSFFKLFSFEFFSESLINFMRRALIGFLVLSIFGLFTRLSLISISVLLTLYMGYEINFFKPKMFQAIFIFVFWVLSFSRCADSFSLDQKFFRKDKVIPDRSWAYGWPIRVVGAIMVYLYLSAGFLKVFHSGTYWFLSDNLAFIFIYLNQPLGIHIGHNFPVLCKILAFGVICFELLWVTYFFRPKLSQILLVPSLLLHLCSYFTLGLVFLPFAFFHIFLFDWDWVVNKFSRGLKTKSPGDRDSKVPKVTLRVHFVSMIIILSLFLTETLGNPNKPFNWPFVSFSMFASPYLINNKQFSNVEVYMFLDDGTEVLPDNELAHPFTTKHFREIFNKMHRRKMINEIEVALRDAISRYKGVKKVRGVVIYKVEWVDIEIEKFSRIEPSNKTELFRYTLNSEGKRN